jgi:hypothetical protein
MKRITKDDALEAPGGQLSTGGFRWWRSRWGWVGQKRGTRKRKENIQAESAEDDQQEVDGEDVGYPEGESQDHGQDAQPVQTLVPGL